MPTGSAAAKGKTEKVTGLVKSKLTGAGPRPAEGSNDLLHLPQVLFYLKMRKHLIQPAITSATQIISQNETDSQIENPSRS